MMARFSPWLFLAARSAALRPAPSSVLRGQRTRLPIAQLGYSEHAGLDQHGHALVLPIGWAAGVDWASGATYYYHEQTGHSQWEPPATQQGSGAQVVWRLAGSPGVTGFVDKGSHFQQDDYALPYKLRHGDEQVLSRFHMVDQKLTVSRKQAIVQVHADGSAALTSLGRGPTLWRALGMAWVALQAGDSLGLTDGDQVSLDCNDPEAAFFTCQEESARQRGGHAQQGGYAQQGGHPQIPEPWEQLVDQSGAVYYSHSQTGESSWDAVGKGYTGG